MGFRWPTMPGSGRAQVAQQIGAIGAGIGALGEEINAQQAEVELQAFRIQFEGEIDALGDRIDKNQDENTYIPETDKVIAGTKEYWPTNGLAKRRAAEFVSRRTPQLHNDARTSQKLRIQSKWDAGLRTEVDNAVQRGHTIDLTQYVDEGLKNGNIDEADAQRVLQDTRHKAEIEAARQFAMRDPETFLNFIDDGRIDPSLGFETLDAGDVINLRSIAQGQITFDSKDTTVARRQAITAVTTNAAKLAASGDYSGAQIELINNIDLLGDQLFTTSLRNLKTTSELLASTGINYYEVTHKPSVFWELDKQIKDGKLTDPAFVYQRTGANGISETDAARLAKRIPKQGGSANDFRNGAAATMFLNAYKAAVSNNLLLDEAGLGKELGLRWLEDSLQRHPEWSLRQVDEEALRIMEKVQQAEIEETLPTTVDELKGLRVKAEKKTNRDIMQRIWEQMTEDERVIAMQALKQGKTAKEIIAFFEANK